MANLHIKMLFLLQAIFVLLGSVEGGYELVKADSECWPVNRYGITTITEPSMKDKGIPENDCECGYKARQLGLKLFLTCHNIRGFYCYVYSPNKADLKDTCEMKHNKSKCKIYRVTKGTNGSCNGNGNGASNCKSKDKKIAALSQKNADLKSTLADQTLLIAKLKKSCKKRIG